MILTVSELTAPLYADLYCRFEECIFQNSLDASQIFYLHNVLSTNSIMPVLFIHLHPTNSRNDFQRCINLLHNIDIFRPKPSRLRLPDKLTVVKDNSFDSKLQLSIGLGALLAAVCCDKPAPRSSPAAISVGPDDKDIMQSVFKHDADM